jgi:hypothetical protein
MLDLEIEANKPNKARLAPSQATRACCLGGGFCPAVGVELSVKLLAAVD